MPALSFALRAASLVLNWIRLRGLPAHLGRIRSARRVLKTLRAMRGEAAEARLFGYLRKLDPLVFEELILCAIEQAGALVVRNLRYTGDGGVDGRAWIPGLGWCAVQSKRYGAHIHHDHVAAFGKALTRCGERHGLFVHCGRTGAASYQHLTDRRVLLVSGARLVALLCHARLPSPGYSARRSTFSTDRA